MPNRLAQSSSPYLLQHAHNPVDWFPWGNEALEKARREHKLIFLSIGYSSCHWCHVMERESFEDADTAAFLNKHFVSIKVDREERPDVDALYMESIQMMTGHGGWPLSVWLTPDTVPVFGGTYFPPRPAQNMPSFMQVLQRMVEITEKEPETLSKRADDIRKAIGQDLLAAVQASTPDDDRFDDAADHYMQQYDAEHGGFSPAPKFPMAMGISFLLKHAALSGARHTRIKGEATDSAAAALHSLEEMSRGGMYDQIGGGFHRYSVDARWHVPHFEKMLYDNALLLNALCDGIIFLKESGREDAGAARQLKRFQQVAVQTTDFLKREMRHSNGGFFSALDADSEGVEGKFYIWTQEEAARALAEFSPAERERIFTYFDLTKEGNWPEQRASIPRLCTAEKLEHPEGDSAPAELMERARKTLLQARAARVRPALDDKLITAWNAMLLKALARLGRLHPEASEAAGYRNTALQLADFLAQTMLQEGQVMRIFKDEQVSQPGFLDDVGLLAEAFSHVFELTGQARWLHLADSLCSQLLEDFYDEVHQGFYYTSGRHEQLLTRNRDLFDNAVPSGNSAAIAALLRTGRLTGKPAFTRAGEASFHKLFDTAVKHASAFGYLLDSGLQHEKHTYEIVISGPQPQPFTEALKPGGPASRPAFAGYIISSGNAAEIPYQPFQEKAPLRGNTACYVCEHFSCAAPVDSPEQLA